MTPSLFPSPLPAPQQALLAAASCLERSGLERAPAADVEAAGQLWFGMYLQNWAGAYEALGAQGLAQFDGSVIALTPAGVEQARALRLSHPRSLFTYNEFYFRARRSPAHARFCERVYGRDLCQHGMADMAQLEDLAALLRQDRAQGRAHRILDLGCGNGAICDWLAGATGAHVTGVDFAVEGTAWAEEFARERPGQLEFINASMLDLDFPAGSFDAVLLIDSFYFAAGQDEFLRRLAGFVDPGGSLYFFYSHSVDDPARRAELDLDETPLARQLKGLGMAYSFTDYSSAEAEHWKIKLAVAAEMRPEFAAEGNDWLGYRRWIEPEQHNRYVSLGCVSRFLYRVPCGQSQGDAPQP